MIYCDRVRSHHHIVVLNDSIKTACDTTASRMHYDEVINMKWFGLSGIAVGAT